VPAGEGKAFWVMTSLVTCKVGSQDTQGRYSLFESLDQPNSGPPMHVHHREDESYYILEGDYEIHREGEAPLRATAGAFVHVPRGTIHTYKNVAATPGRMVVMTTPAGLEGFFAEVGQPATDRSSPPVLVGPPDLGKMAAIARKYELEITGPPPR
jgi:mannose-6-phosphate isomerase-like protein (cupin superfamily)